MRRFIRWVRFSEGCDTFLKYGFDTDPALGPALNEISDLFRE